MNLCKSRNITLFARKECHTLFQNTTHTVPKYAFGTGHILEGFFGANAPVGPSSCPSNNVENSIFAPENGPL